ncbi:hypothetical protein OWV82_019536 [Melia azedarach]|uniref:Uncharacterized protein n=1 Tax=Melia azedarach TaxID=155640 RepID=A0ACC1X314_MELAZ|nr:hypothetical protein OWV82_019536 [Melia azedarach]
MQEAENRKASGLWAHEYYTVSSQILQLTLGAVLVTQNACCFRRQLRSTWKHFNLSGCPSYCDRSGIELDVPAASPLLLIDAYAGNLASLSSLPEKVTSLLPRRLIWLM